MFGMLLCCVNKAHFRGGVGISISCVRSFKVSCNTPADRRTVLFSPVVVDGMRDFSVHLLFLSRRKGEGM